MFSQSFFLLSNLTAENTQDHSVLTEHKNLGVLRLFIFRLRLITISVGMLCKPSGVFSRSSENKTNRKRNLIIFPEYLILTFVMFVTKDYRK